MSEQYKFLLSESEMPTQWYNIIPDLPNPLPPPLNPQTMEPIGPEDLAPLFPMGLILQEVSQDSFIDIPKPILDLYIVRGKKLNISLIIEHRVHVLLFFLKPFLLPYLKYQLIDTNQL